MTHAFLDVFEFLLMFLVPLWESILKLLVRLAGAGWGKGGVGQIKRPKNKKIENKTTNPLTDF